jgi:hypothetical protein
MAPLGLCHEHDDVGPVEHDAHREHEREGIEFVDEPVVNRHLHIRLNKNRGSLCIRGCSKGTVELLQASSSI